MLAPAAFLVARRARAQDDVDPASSAARQALRVLLGQGDAQPSVGQTFSFDGKLYRGTFQRTADGQIVDLVDLEGYLYSVVPREMPSSWPVWALEAQSICARTYVLQRSDPRRAYDLVPSEVDQRYDGLERGDAGRGRGRRCHRRKRAFVRRSIRANSIFVVLRRPYRVGVRGLGKFCAAIPLGSNLHVVLGLSELSLATEPRFRRDRLAAFRFSRDARQPQRRAHRRTRRERTGALARAADRSREHRCHWKRVSPGRRIARVAEPPAHGRAASTGRCRDSLYGRRPRARRRPLPVGRARHGADRTAAVRDSRLLLSGYGHSESRATPLILSTSFRPS